MAITLTKMTDVPKQRKAKRFSKPPEGRVKDAIKDLFDKYNVYWFMPVTGGFNRSGIPDFIACSNGMFLAVEAKSKHTRHGVTALQAQNIEQILSCGGLALVVDEDNLDELENLIKQTQTGA